MKLTFNPTMKQRLKIKANKIFDISTTIKMHFITQAFVLIQLFLFYYQWFGIY